MPIETIASINQTYYLVAFDASGDERQDDPDGLMSQQAVKVLKGEPITDVFVFSHGWKGDVPAAREQYAAWIKAMLGVTTDIQAFRAVRPDFRPLFIGIHWPSLPWGDEELVASGRSFAAPTLVATEDLIDRFAERIADTPAARVALRTIITAARDRAGSFELPKDVGDAYRVLFAESGLRSDGPGGAPGDDQEPFDPSTRFELGEEAASYGGNSTPSGLLSPLVQLSFWKMKNRGRTIGESGGYKFLRELLDARSNARIHLMGHSFGCITVSAMLNGPSGLGSLPRPVNSIALVQGALSLWSYCSAIPLQLPLMQPRPGYFRKLIDDGKIVGPIVTTRSMFDTAVGKFYPIGAGIAFQADFPAGKYPLYGGIGAFGIRGEGLSIDDQKMASINEAYNFKAGMIYNLDSNAYIRNGTGPAGAHNDIAHPEVAHAIWQAALIR